MPEVRTRDGTRKLKMMSAEALGYLGYIALETSGNKRQREERAQMVIKKLSTSVPNISPSTFKSIPSI